MATSRPERFFARILFKYASKDGHAGREICYIYNREDLDALYLIKKHTFDNSQFIEIGDILVLEDRKCEVKQINFKLYNEINEMGHGFGVNVLSPSDPTDFNCQIGVFVERID